MKLDFEEQIGRIYGANPSTARSYQRINENEINFTTHFNNGLHSIKREVTFEQQIKEQFDLDILALLGNRVDDGVYWFDVVLMLQDCCYSLQTTLSVETHYYQVKFSYLDVSENPNQWYSGKDKESMFPDLFLLDALQSSICRYLEEHPAFRLYFATGIFS